MSPKKGVDIYVKLESENPGGSVKDRLAVGVIEWAEQNGQLKPGQTVVEATSGNTGIGLAMVCARRGYPFVCVMAESFSIERRKLMRFLGARVLLVSHSTRSSCWFPSSFYSFLCVLDKPCAQRNWYGD